MRARFSLTQSPCSASFCFAAFSMRSISVGCGPPGGSFEVEVTQAGDITVFAPPGTLVQIFGPGGEISSGWACATLMPPALPEDMSMPEFIKLMFGSKS